MAPQEGLRHRGVSGERHRPGGGLGMRTLAASHGRHGRVPRLGDGGPGPNRRSDWILKCILSLSFSEDLTGYFFGGLAFIIRYDQVIDS